MIVSFGKDDKGWYLLELASTYTREERSMIVGFNTLLDKVFPDAAVNSGRALQMYPTERNPHWEKEYRKAGFSALYKQQDPASGGAIYACPSVEGDEVNYYLCVSEPMKEVLGGFAELIYFK